MRNTDFSSCPGLLWHKRNRIGNGGDPTFWGQSYRPRLCLRRQQYSGFRL